MKTAAMRLSAIVLILSLILPFSGCASVSLPPVPEPGETAEQQSNTEFSEPVEVEYEEKDSDKPPEIVSEEPTLPMDTPDSDKLEPENMQDDTEPSSTTAPSPSPTPTPTPSPTPAPTTTPSPSPTPTPTPTPSPSPTPAPTPTPTPSPTPTPTPTPTPAGGTPVITIRNQTVPGDMQEGNSFNLKGVVETDRGYLTEVYAALTDENGKAAQDCKYAPFTSNLNIVSTVNLALTFSKLEPGVYTYTLKATAYNAGKNATETLISNSFTVVAATSVTPEPTGEPSAYKAQYTDDESNAGRIWNYFINEFNNPYAAAAIVGNIAAESGCNPKIVEGDISGGYFSSNYTASVDNGSISRNTFAYSTPAEGYGGGYGLCQWTGARKGELYDYAKSVGSSVGNLDMQLGFIMYEINNKYPELIEYMKNADNVSNAVSKFCSIFEQAAIYGGRSVYAKQYLEKYGK